MSDFQSNAAFPSSIDFRVPPRFFYSLPPSFMIPPGQDTISLWCLVDGKTTPTRVTLTPHHNTDDLKTAIKAKEELSFPVSSIVVWKLNTRIPLKPRNTLATRIQQQGEDTPAISTELDPWDKLSDLFTQHPAEDELHIIATLDNCGPGDTPDFSTTSRIRPRSPAEEDPREAKRQNISTGNDYLWLKELHTKLWGRTDLKVHLFRETEVTSAHYDELQRRLKQQNPDRDSPGYNAGTHNVLGVKLDILRSYKPITPSPLQQPPSNNNKNQADNDEGLEESDVDAPEIHSFLPSNLRFLDLSSLQLKKVSPRLPLPLFLRPEYDYISNLIGQLPRSNAGCAIVTGQPGTGKTAFLHLKILESMIDGRPFLYQALDGFVYHIANDVDTVLTLPSNDPIVAFVDGDNADYTPKMFLRQSSVQIIVASSPKGTEQKWLKQAGHLARVTIYAADLWTPSELFLTGIFLNPHDLTFTRLKESASYFGFNPRRCFATARFARELDQAKANLARKINEASTKGRIIGLVSLTNVDDSHVSHTIFELSSTDQERHFYQCQIRAASSWALDLLLKTYEAAQVDAAAEFYHSLARVPYAGSLRGRLFERQVLKYLDTIGDQHKFMIRDLATSVREEWSYPGPAPSFTIESPTFTGALSAAIHKGKPLHLVPSNPNFAAVDSVLYAPNEVLTCIQITVSDKHPVEVSGLKQIQGWLKKNTPLASLRPSGNGKHWRLIFIVPSAMESNFGLQPFRGDTDKCEWAGKVDMYVLGLEEDGLFQI